MDGKIIELTIFFVNHVVFFFGIKGDQREVLLKCFQFFQGQDLGSFHELNYYIGTLIQERYRNSAPVQKTYDLTKCLCEWELMPLSLHVNQKREQ